jgi:glycosyltransferase involved in cell wall biosynthesis
LHAERSGILLLHMEQRRKGKMERVLFLTWGIEFGGLEVVLLDWLSGVDYSQVSVIVGCREPEILRGRLRAKNWPVELIELGFSGDEPLWEALSKWFHLFRSIRPSKIIFLEGIFAQFDLAAIFAAWWTTRGQACLFLGGWGRDLPPQSSAGASTGFRRRVSPYKLRQILAYGLRARLLRRTLVGSETLEDHLFAAFHYPRSRTSALIHGVDTARFRPCSVERLAFRTAHGIPHDALVIVSHGRLVRVKRPDRLLHAFAALAGAGSTLCLLIAGEGPLKAGLEKIALDSAMGERVKFMCFQEDSSALLMASDIYVMASEHEGFGIALLEAMSTGLICVATNCGGPGEILTNGENGILVEVSDQGVGAGLLRAVQLSPEERTRLGANARKTVESCFELHTAIRNALDAMEMPLRPGLL